MKTRGILRKTWTEAIVQWQHLVLLRLIPPHIDHPFQPLGVTFGEIIDFREISIEMKQLPLVFLKCRAGRMKCDGLPAVVPKPAMTEHLEILRLGARGRVRIGERFHETLAFQRHLFISADRQWRLNTDHIQKCRHKIRGVDELMAQFALGLDPLRPRDHERIANAAAMGILLVAPQRRVGCHRPAQRKIRMSVRPADIVDALQFFRDRLRAKIIRPHRVDKTQRPALLAGAIVGQHHNQRVVPHARGFEECDQPREMLIRMIEHSCKCRLKAREDAALVFAVLVPGFDAVITRRHPGLLRHKTHRLLPRQAPFALHVPPMPEVLVVALDQIAWRLMRRMARPESQPCQPRQIGTIRHVIGDKANGLIDEIRRQVIAGLIGARWIDMRIVGDKFG